MHHIYILITLILGVTSQSDCRFAFKYSQEDLKTKPDVLQDFLKTVVQWESKFAKTIGIDATSGLTLDGQQLDVTTGEPYGPAHQFTASSKESIHVALLALALDNNTYAKLIYTEEEAISLLERKIKTYEKFDSDYPGYGGFLPWVAVNNGIVTPTWDWTDGVPSLDNGQLFWAAYGLVAVLEKTNKYPDLVSRYTRFYKKMAQNAPKIFYEGGGLIRAVTRIKDVKLAVEQNQYTNRIQDCTDFNQPCYLDDPYEGELFAWMMHLFSPISTLDRDSIWIQKRTKLQASQFTVKSTGKQITVEKGWWFSAHEQWKYLFFPYLSNQLQQKLVTNAEKARTWDAKQNGRPGMFASVTGNITSNSDQVYYFSDCGVQEVAFQTVSHDQLVTPYSTMAMFLVNRTVAAVWYHNMISGPAGQNQYGSTEGVTINGQTVSPFVTWDSKITTVLGIAGGIQDQISIKLYNEGLLKPALQILDKEWSSVFTDIKGTDIEFAYPDVKVPLIKKDFTTCQLQISE